MPPRPTRRLPGALGEQARRVHQIAARNVHQVGDVDNTRPGVFLFNYFAGNDPVLAVELWEYLAGWYEAETGLDNSTLLARWTANRPTTC